MPPSVPAFLLSITVFFAGAANARADVSMASLLEEMPDLEALTRLSPAPYTVRQFSSYDRKSDGAARTDRDWFANGDRGQHLRTEERDGATEWVMMDAPGPGAIVRIWSANPIDAGIVRIYLDHSETPAIEMPLSDLLGGTVFPFIEPIAGTRSSGMNSHLPIPYARHCKVTASKPDFYYHINYRTYAGATVAETFSDQVVANNADRIRAVAKRLADPMSIAAVAGSGDSQSFSFELAPGSVEEEVLSGENSAIYALSVHVAAVDLDDALRKCVLSITFDDVEQPQVVTPLGDFFATAPGINSFVSLPLAVRQGGQMQSAWVMPYQRSARIRIQNLSESRVSAQGAIRLGSYTWTDASLYFHANWRGQYPVATRPRHDWTFIDISGQGRFVGTMMHVMNPLSMWWGEGDEKIYVDGEAFPSHFGTGSEDYFGYAWCSPALFTHAYHNQTRCDGPGNYGNTCLSRFHIIDNIPFTSGFTFDMEVWHAWKCDVALAATTYWYARPGAASTPATIDPADLVIVTPPPLPVARTVEGAIEGESMEVVGQPSGSLTVENQPAFGWSGGKQIRWRDGKIGDSIAFVFPMEKAGDYNLRAVFTKASQYGIAELSVNGEAVTGHFDMYSPDVEVTEEVALGTFKLREGQNRFTATIVGKNAKAGTHNMFGVDYLIAEPVP